MTPVIKVLKVKEGIRLRACNGIIKPITNDMEQLLHKWIEWIETGWVGGGVQVST